MQFFPATYQLFVRAKNMISDKLRSLLLFTGIPVPSRPGKAAFACSPQQPLGLGSPCCPAETLLGSLHSSANLWHWCYRAFCPSTPLIIPSRENWRSEIG